MGSGASKRGALDGKTTDQARAEGAAQVQQFVSGILFINVIWSWIVFILLIYWKTCNPSRRNGDLMNQTNIYIKELMK